MKLYEIPKNSKIECEISDGSKSLIFHHLDGSYSYCISEKENVCHLHASTELIQVRPDVYKIKG